MIKILLLFIFLLPFSPATSSYAAALNGKVFDEEINIQNTKFVLKGMGLKTVLFVKVFVAGFYVAENTENRKASEDISKRLEVAYLYPIPGRKLAVETRQRVILNTTKSEFASIKDRVDQMDGYFVDLKPGDRYALTYISGSGTAFSYNGKVMGTIPGYDFAKALFAVWIGEKPISPVLKKNLLGADKENMVRLGSALKKFLAFRVVGVDLYIAEGYGAKDVFTDIPKRLEVNYHVNVPKHELDKATIKGIKSNFTPVEFNALMPQIRQINSYYPNIRSGDQIAVTYIPELGSQVEINGQIKGVVQGEQFAKAFFSIWVGENPVDERAKYQLLGDKK